MDKEALERRLAAIFEEAEEAGIHLDSKPERVPVSRGDRLAESFEEISRFVDECGREPVKGLSMNERRLAARLEQIRQDPVRAAQLRPIDRHGLLVRTANQLRAEADGPSVAAEPGAILSVHERCTQEQRDALKHGRWTIQLDGRAQTIDGPPPAPGFTPTFRVRS